MCVGYTLLLKANSEFIFICKCSYSKLIITSTPEVSTDEMFSVCFLEKTNNTLNTSVYLLFFFFFN